MLVDDWGPPACFALSTLAVVLAVRAGSVLACMIAMLFGLFSLCAGVDRWFELRRRERR